MQSEPSEPSEAGAKREQINFVPFVKSSADLPGTIDQNNAGEKEMSNLNSDLHENTNKVEDDDDNKPKGLDLKVIFKPDQILLSYFRD